MARPEVICRRTRAADKMEPGDREAYSVEAFARAHSISVAMFYKLRAQGLAPTCFKVGARTLISHEAAARWRVEREQATAEECERKAVNKPEKQSAR
jgi:hypothetical protein